MRIGDVENVYGARPVRDIALEKDFWFRVEGNGAEGHNETSGETQADERPSHMRDMAEFRAMFVQSAWVGYHLVRLLTIFFCISHISFDILLPHCSVSAIIHF